MTNGKITVKKRGEGQGRERERERGGGQGTKATNPRETGRRKKDLLKNCMTHNRRTLQLRDK